MCEVCAKSKHSVDHYDQIGWLITSFFLVFLGTVLTVIIQWSNNPVGISPFFIILITMFFGYIVARLFLKSQYNKAKNIYGNNFRKYLYFLNPSIWIYTIFIICIGLFLEYLLTKANIVSQTSLFMPSSMFIVLAAILLEVDLILIKWVMVKRKKKV